MSVARVLQMCESPALVAVPAVLVACAFFGIEQSAVLTLLVALLALGVFIAGFEASRPALRIIMPTVVLAALAAAGRVLFAVVPNVQPLTAIAILAGAVFGKRSGFMVGALAALVSNLFLGQGPWTPWQMYAWGLAGWGAGLLSDRGWFKRAPVRYGYGFAAAFLFGVLMNSWYVVGFVHPLTLPTVLLAFGAALPFDAAHAVSTVVFLAALYEPWHRKLTRIKHKFALDGKSDTIPLPTAEKEATMVRVSTLQETLDALRRGEAVIFPTETVYGLGVSVQAASGPDVLFDLKQRDHTKPVAWLVGDASDLARYGRAVPPLAEALARTCWPGPLTLIVNASDEVPEAFRSAQGTIGLRMPQNETALKLIREVGCPVATTSANLSGEQAPCTAEALDPALVAKVAAVLSDNDDQTKSGIASTVLDCTADHPVVLREGALTIEQLKALG